MKNAKIIRFLLFIPLIMLVSNCKSNKNTSDNNNGFTVLFNGKNWDGWYLKLRSGDPEMAKKVFAIDDGMVHVFKDTPDSLDLNTGDNFTHGMFYTKKKYSKYILRFEYKWGTKIANNFAQFQHDAGLYYHVTDDAIWPKGLEFQIRYDNTKNENHTGDFWATKVKINTWYADENEAYLSQKDGGKLQPVKPREHRALAGAKFNGLNDKWNSCELIVMGDKYAIQKLNGQIVNVGEGLTQGEGIFGFQAETSEIYYRNIKIKELDSFVPIEKFLKK